MTHVLRLSRARIAGACLALTVIAPASAPVLAQAAVPRSDRELEELVPASAYQMLHLQHDPSMEFVERSSRKVLQAVKDARFHELAIDFLDIAVDGSGDGQQIEMLFEHLSQLVGNVDWEALVESEMVYAELPISMFPAAWPGVGSYLFACRPDPQRVPELERSLATLLSAADGLTDELRLLKSERNIPGGSSTRVYSLLFNDDDLPQIIRKPPLLQMAVRDDIIMLGCGSKAFGDSLAILEGKSKQSLVRTRRYRVAVGELGDDLPSLTYFDVHRLLTWLGTEIPRFMERIPGSQQAISPVQDILELADFIDVTVTGTHARGHELISECWTSYRPAAVKQGNPLYLAISGAEPTGELLNFVPANAISFAMSQSLDFRPLYRWTLDRVEYYVPQVADNLLWLNGIQALMDFSIEDDLLSWLGSETITIVLPSQRPGTQAETIIISQLRDPAGARKSLGRIVAVFDAIVQPLLDRLEQEMARDGTQSPIRKLELTKAKGGFSSMMRLEIAISVPGLLIPIPPIPPVIFGVIGNLLVITTSEDAIGSVLAAAAGEEDGIWEHPAMAIEDRLPGPHVISASLQPVGRQLQEVSNAIGAAAGSLSMVKMIMAKSGGTDADQNARMIGLLTSGMQKVGSILRSMDFLEDAVSYSELRDNGLTHYSRTSVRYRDDADR